MKKLIIVFCGLILVVTAYAEEKKLLAVFNEQINAFNQRDVDRLANNVTEDFKYFFLTADELVMETSGKVAFRTAMENYFKSRKNKIVSTIESTTVDGNRISFREIIYHKNKAGEKVLSSALGVYEIRQGKIYRAWYFVD